MLLVDMLCYLRFMSYVYLVD